MKIHSPPPFQLALVVCLMCPHAFSQTIIDEWNTVKAPSAPELKSIKIDPKVTALLMLDFNKQTCNAERRPRCVASIPKVQKLLMEARAKDVPVIYSLSSGAAVTDIAKELTPLTAEPVVASGPDKFLGTDLEKILKEKGVKTVVVVGTASQGAVLYTRAEPHCGGCRSSSRWTGRPLRTPMPNSMWRGIC